jgi:PTH1 family peptidyl-tRNA hydrolase
MILIVGLGNPGEKYEKTRHNLGFMVVEKLAREMVDGQWLMVDKFQSLITKHKSSTILAKPQTMMNASGFAVSKLANFYKIKPEDIWIVHDDVDLPLGKIKIRFGGGAAGHHGVESIIEQLGTDDFTRFRLGIGHPGRGADAQVEKYVLREFDVNEASETKRMIKQSVKAIQVALDHSLARAMNQFNLK